MPAPHSAKERLIFALDVPGEREAIRYVNELKDIVSFYKVGWELFLSTGLTFVRQLKQDGFKVFLDLKLTPDVEEQLRRTVTLLAEAHVEFITIHGNGKTARIVQQARGRLPVKILSLTVLTNMGLADVRDLYIGQPDKDLETIEDFVRYRAKESLDIG